MMTTTKPNRPLLRKLLGALLKGLAIACVSSTSAAPAAGADGSAAEPMDVVLIFSDEMMPDYIGAYGGHYPTPNIDRLAREGMRFTQAYTSASACTPSRYSVLTGQYPERCRDAEFAEQGEPDDPYMVSWNTRIDRQTATIPRILAPLGFRSGMFGKNHVTRPDGWRIAQERLPSPPEGDIDEPAVDAWLRAHQEVLVDFVSTELGFDTAGALVYGNNDARLLKGAFAHHNMPWIAAHATRFIRESAGQTPYFAFITPTAIHGPWHPDAFTHDLRRTPGGYEEEVADFTIPEDEMAALRVKMDDLSSGEKHHTAGMADLDNLVGHVLREIEASGRADRTIVIFTADHGTEPGKANAYPRGNHIPLIVRWPGLTKPGGVSDELVAHVDLFATLAAHFGAPVPKDHHPDGVDIRPLLADPKRPVREFVYATQGYARAVCDGHYFLLAYRFPDRWTQQMKSGEMKHAPNHLSPRWSTAQFAADLFPNYYDPDQLYDLTADPWLETNLWNAPRVAGVQSRLTACLRNVVASFDRPFPEHADPFYLTPEFRRLVEKAKEKQWGDLPAWIEHDHDAVTWPPVR